MASEENVGQSHSTSPNACMIRFKGGPYDGKQGLFDHQEYDQIGVSVAVERTTYGYTRSGNREYTLTLTHRWQETPTEPSDAE